MESTKTFNYDRNKQTITQSLGISDERYEQLRAGFESVTDAYDKEGSIGTDDIVEGFTNFAENTQELVFAGISAGKLIRYFEEDNEPQVKVIKIAVENKSSDSNEKFEEINFNDNADTYGELVGLTKEREEELRKLCENSLREMVGSGNPFGSRQLVKKFQSHAKTTAERVSLAVIAGMKIKEFDTREERLKNKIGKDVHSFITSLLSDDN